MGSVYVTDLTKTCNPSASIETQLSPWAALERSVHQALLTYSNVHRGTGHFSQASTLLYERARHIVMEHFSADPSRHVVIFGSKARQAALRRELDLGTYDHISSAELGLHLGVHAMLVQRRALPPGIPAQPGGGAVQLVGEDSVVWAQAPERFEAGTPAVINVIAFARALQFVQRHGPRLFRDAPTDPPTGMWQEDGSQRVERLNLLRHTMLGQNIRVPITDGARPYVNLDNGASTPCLLPAWDAVRASWRLDECGRQTALAQTRAMCHRFLDAPADAYDLCFAANTTEALNMLAEALSEEWANGPEEPVVINTWMEHHSNDLPWRYLPGATLCRLDVDGEGFLSLSELEATLRAYNEAHLHGDKRVKLVAITGASNVLGTCNPLGDMARLAHQYGAQLLVDGAQLLAHRSVSLWADDVDFFAFSAHKAYAPFGSGGLVYRRAALPQANVTFNSWQASGQENVVGIVALGEALRQLEATGMDVVEEAERALTAFAMERLSELPELRILGVADPASPHFSARSGVISFSVRNVPHNVAARELAQRGGIGVRNGCFCAHMVSKQLMGIVPWRERAGEFGLGVVPDFTAAVLPGLVRASLGIENGRHEIDHLCDTLRTIIAAPRGPLSRFVAHTYNGLPWQRATSAQRRIDAFCHNIAKQVFG